MIRRFAVITILLAWCALPPMARAGTLGTDIIGMFPKEIGEFAYADLRQARTQSWFPQLKQQMLPARFRQFERLLASAGVDPKAPGGEVGPALVALAWAEGT